MTEFLSFQFTDDENFISTFDELPLWSAPFGLLMLKHLELKQAITLLDIGCGAGFPLTELAERLGQSSKVFGIDPWKTATTRASLKIRNFGLKNITLLEQSAEKLPFQNETVDTIVSNLGINNFDDPACVFKECFRVLKPGGNLALTTNLFGHWKVFYTVFEQTLRSLGHPDLVEALRKEEEHRGNVNSISKLFTDNGFKMNQVAEEQLDMKFIDGTAFLNHHFVKVGWLGSWKALIPEALQQEIFGALENNLNAFAAKNNGLKLGVPMAYMEGVKN